MTDHITERLSEYLDGTLSTAERSGVEAHLAACGECRGVLAELEQVVARARALPDRPPATDLWPGIAARIGAAAAPAGVSALAARRARRSSVSVPQLAAAGIALMLVGAGAVALALRSAGTDRGRVAARGEPALNQRWVTNVTPKYDSAVAQLQAALVEGQRTGQLDSATVRVVERSLATIDAAIVEARRALAADPGNTYLNHHLADTMRRKLDLLRQATAIATARS
ncbi:MAG TPA: zf-HC2 domain-containing protein [Gemmatimonadales bacterium]|nr:zf-HC2 domain-containing protein [Gemmatimonadales bacterium]